MNSGMMYLTNDDTSIQETLSGMRLGEPFPLSWFVNVLATAPIAFLYKLFPGVQWWFCYSHALMVIGMFLANYCLILSSHKTPIIMRLVAVLLAIAFDLAFILYPITKIAFTIVPSVLGAGVVSLVLLTGERRALGHWIACVLLFVLLLAHREESGLIVLCYVLLALLAGFAIAPHKHSVVRFLTHVLVPSCALLLLAVAVIWGNRVIQDNANGQDYRAFNDARSSFIDYEHDGYDKNQEAYNHVGWNGDLYMLVSNWCFMDEHVNTRSFEYVCEHQVTQRDWASVAEHEWGQLLSHPLAGTILIAWVTVSVGACLAMLIGRRWAPLGMHVLNMLGTIAIIALQLLLGRVLYRTVVVAIIPSTALGLMLSYMAFRGERWPWALVAFCAFSLVMLGLGAQESIRIAFDKSNINPLLESASQVEELQEYAIAHPGIVYIKGPSVPSSTSPRKIYLSDQPTNVLSWGGSEFGSNASRKRVLLNGLDSYTGDVFSREDVRLVSGIPLQDISSSLDGTDTLSSFLRWQRDAYGAKGVIQLTSPTKGVYILRMIYDDQDEEFYQQYEQGFVLPVYDVEQPEQWEQSDQWEQWDEADQWEQW